MTDSALAFDGSDGTAENSALRYITAVGGTAHLVVPTRTLPIPEVPVSPPRYGLISVLHGRWRSRPSDLSIKHS